VPVKCGGVAVNRRAPGGAARKNGGAGAKAVRAPAPTIRSMDGTHNHSQENPWT